MKIVICTLAFFLSAIFATAQPSPKGLLVNDEAPVFSAKDQAGNLIQLEEELKKGPVVLVFYRGYWCPYCNRYLKQLEDSLLQISSKGARLLAVTAELPENIEQTAQKTKASYPILFDDGMKIMKNYDVAYAVDEKTIQAYKGYGIDFAKINGPSNGTNLPIPAIFVINKQGKIVFRHFDKDYTKRAPVAEILKWL